MIHELVANSTNLLLYYAMQGVEMLYKSGYNFNKAGVIVEDLVPQSTVQQAFWQQEDKGKNKAVMKALDNINDCLGTDTVKFAAQGYSKERALCCDYLSKCYTRRLDHVVTVKD